MARMHIYAYNAVAFPEKRFKTKAMKHTPRLFQILAILSLCMHLMASITPLWAMESGGLRIQICSGDAWKTITVDENGKQVPDKPQPRKHHCVFCANASLSGVENAPALFIPPPHTKQFHDSHKTSLTDNTPAKRAHQTRAPPVLS